MKVRGTRSTIAVVATLITAALMLTALVAVIGSAQAAPTKKVYDATVRVTPATTPAAASATLRLTLTNNNQSTQTLGSANFTAPTGVTVQSVVVQPPPPVAPNSTTNRAGWTAAKNANGTIVEFRSTSNALPKTASVFADVVVAISTTTPPVCGNATWTAAAKQSNDFSGTGNDFAAGTSTNLRPLGSLTIADIGTTVQDPDGVADPVFAPQVAIPDPAAAVNVAAFDVCGAPYPKYGSAFGTGATLVRTGVPPTPARLVHANIPAIAWSAAVTGADVGTGSTTLDPAAGEAETGDLLVLDDQSTDIAGDSNVFDVVEKICTVFDDACHWPTNPNSKIKVDAAPPTDPDASLGIGFIDGASFDCGSGSTSVLGGQLIYINPRDYPSTEGQSVAITYDKTVPGTSGNVEDFGSCISKDNGDSWDPITDCEHSPPEAGDALPLPCIQNRARVQGNLVLTLFFNPSADPLSGGRR